MMELLCTLADHANDINSCAFSDSYLATSSLDKTIRVYSLKDFKEVHFSPLIGHTYTVHCCCLSYDKPILASCSTDGKTILWDMHNGQIMATFEQPNGNPVRVCKFSPSSIYLASGAADGSVVLWNVPLLKFHRSSTVKDGYPVACAFYPGGNVFVTGSSSGDLTAWDENMRCLYTDKAHDLGVTCCDFSSQPITDEQYGTECFQMASCGQDNEIRLWIVSFSDAQGFEMMCKLTLSGHSAPVLCCALSKDGSILVSGSVDKSVIIYKAKTGSILHTLTRHTRYVTACALAPNLPLLATGSMDKTVNIWRLEQGSNLQIDAVENKTETPIVSWSEEDVLVWLSREGLTEVEHIFKRNNIDGKELVNLTKEILQRDLNIESLGLRNKILRKIEDVKKKTASTNIPDEFLCPITREIMMDPVIASDGYSYERKAIENWISTQKRTSPMTNLPLSTLLLTPNRTLKMALNRWLEAQ
ncbi:WD repeat, SAM and U-box domain-containing protein 1 isoform X1 [Bombina bombina]|uniref:WD repeat, SAM and U-box domain-containing protein 1 isoform X1 n=1 Tax=Bombina bombina TaxID=8345 RepID=UPI00235A99D9|nr:WD repeat, SAM and U-box domain-containing protein 1 isoform X1 [Bombina bombina]